jgi:hypothetical protein
MRKNAANRVLVHCFSSAFLLVNFRVTTRYHVKNIARSEKLIILEDHGVNCDTELGVSQRGADHLRDILEQTGVT